MFQFGPPPPSPGRSRRGSHRSAPQELSDPRRCKDVLDGLFDRAESERLRAEAKDAQKESERDAESQSEVAGLPG